MKCLTRTQFGNPILRQKAKPVSLSMLRSPSFKKLIADMFYTIEDIGVGLAAPQIGKSLQLAVINIHPLPHRLNVEPCQQVIINPKILNYSKQTSKNFEGCLSFEGLRAQAIRSNWVDVSYLDENGKKHIERSEGFLAQVFQHEIDHLQGTLYIDHVKDLHTMMTTEEFNKQTHKLSS
ncbi:peptide deformylase [Patescibacteria group bacterium]|nr:peptide deformylase [Patescibacteria group bacterium]MBP9709872.1 peptide deformylase [Patescibacteria group bacterium]